MSHGCTVADIAWARVNLTITVVLADELAMADDVQFVLVDGSRTMAVTTERVDPQTCRLTLNVTNFHDRAQVPNGTWRFVPVVEEEFGPAAGFDVSDLSLLDRSTRAYLYANNKVSYIVTFGLSEDDDPDLLMRTYQFFRSSGKGSGGPRSLVGRIRGRVLPRSRRTKIKNRFYALARRLDPPHGNRILFASMMRSGIEGNLLRVRDRLVERGLDKDYEIRYSFNVPGTGSRRSTLKLIYLMATSDTIILDDYFPILETLKVSPDTKIIQAWHAGSGFKNIGYSRFGNYGSPKLSNAHRKYTYAITGSTHLIPVYAEAFGIEESAVVPTGLPRIDTFLDPARTERVREDFFRAHPEFKGKRIILFAPTFRGRGERSAFYDYSMIDLGKFYDVCGSDTVVLFRMHHFIKEPLEIPSWYADRLYDFSHFPSVNDLLLVTDLLITDYSSIIYEFSLLNRPMLFYAYDRHVYAATRGFHRPFAETAPGAICDSMDELIKAIQNEEFELEKVKRFQRENFDRIDTGSADRVIDWLIVGDPPSTDAREVQ